MARFDFIVVGLGNPGPRYQFTRHNIGFLQIDRLADLAKAAWQTSGLAKKIKAQICDLQIDSKKLLLVKPLTYMNLSGESIARLYYEEADLKTVPLLVFHDEVEIPMGKIRVKMGGGDAGHNGLKSLREHLGTGDFLRIRLGVGRPAPGSPLDLATYVLQAFESADEPLLERELKQGAQVLKVYMQKGLQAAQVEASKENP